MTLPGFAILLAFSLFNGFLCIAIKPGGAAIVPFFLYCGISGFMVGCLIAKAGL